MKKFLFVILTFLLFPVFALGLQKEEMHQISLKELSHFSIPSGYQGVQGVTITDQYIVVSANKKDDSLVSLLVFEIDSLELVKTIDNLKYGHANDLAYDEAKDEVLVINSKTIHVLDAKTFEEKTPRTIETSSSAIAKNHNGYAFLAGNAIRFTDDSFVKKSEFAVDTTLITQGIDIYNDHVFLTCFESGVVGNYKPVYDGILEAGANVIYVYNTSGVFQKAFYIPAGYGELESIDFYDGKYYLLFNSPDSKYGYFYTLNYDEVTIKTEVPMTLDESSFPLSSFQASAYENETLVSKVSLVDNKYSFSFQFQEPGVYEYFITQDLNSEYIGYDNKGMVLSYIVNYDFLTNRLKVTSVNDIPMFQNLLLREKISCEEVSGVYYDGNGNVTDRENFVQTCHVVENPQTGFALPLSIFLVGVFLAVLFVVFVRKNKLYNI